MNRTFSLAIAVLVVVIVSAQDEPKKVSTGSTAAPADPALRDELIKRMKTEQDVRKELSKSSGGGGFAIIPAQGPGKSVLDRMRAIDAENLEWFKSVFAKRGWPTFAMVGKEGATGAFLIAQHAVADLDFMDKVLQEVKKAHAVGQAEGQWVALMTDRVLVLKEHKPQRYGTQMTFQDGKMVPQPIEDEANVDLRRKEMGLPPLAGYIKSMNQGLAKRPANVQIMPSPSTVDSKPAPEKKTGAEQKPEPAKKG